MKIKWLNWETAESNGKETGSDKVLGKEEGQPFSQGGWPFTSCSIHRVFDHPEGDRMGSSLWVLALAKNYKLASGLASRS
jgi:hypothetical protein